MVLRIPRRAALPGLLVLLPSTPGRPRAQGAAGPAPWPVRPLRMIVPFPPGGATDLLSRLLAERLGTQLGQSVVAENRGGAAGNIGAEAASSMEPDGYNLFFGTVGTMAINPHLYPRLAWRPEDLVPVVLWADLPNVVAVAHHSPFRTLPELIAAARARPGALSYASSGSGTTLHLSGELLKAMSGIDLLHVPFRGGNDSVNQILGGRVDLAFNNLPTAIGLIRSGELQALAVTGAERSPALPEVPTVAEAAGLPGYEATSWFGLQVPARTPPGVVVRLNAAVNAALADPATRERILALGARPRGGTAEEFADFIAAENRKWAEVIRRAGARVE